jgi:CelD/BcsL family acetyltransferase involved in cellulose biosynthesis
MSDNVEVTIGSCINDFQVCFIDWDELVASSGANTVFSRAGWLSAWSETLGGSEKIIITKVRRNSKLVGAAAFRERDGIIEFAGKGSSDYSDFILSNDLQGDCAVSVIERMLLAAREASKNFRHFFLGRIPGSSNTLHYLPRPYTKMYATICRGVVAPAMDMSAAEEKLRKKSLRRHEKGLERKGKLVDVTYNRADSILPLLEPFFEQHIQRWSNTNSQSLFLNEKNREFYRKVTKYLDRSGCLRFTVLSLNDCMIAAHFGFLQAGRFIWYKPTFDPQLAKFSPGEVLLKRLIEQAQSEGASEFDFTIGDEAFKYRFATKCRNVVNLHITDSWCLSALRRTRVFLSKHLRKNNPLDIVNF